MTAYQILGLLLLALAAASTWLCERVTTNRGGFVLWITYVASLCGGAVLLVP